MISFIFDNFILFIIFTFILTILLHFIPIYQWLISIFSGAHISLTSLIVMRIRRVPVDLIVDSYITAVKAGIDIKSSDLETHYLAGGNVKRVVMALISAEKAGIKLSFNNAAAIDLAGRNVFEAVQISVNPKVIDTPEVSAVTKNGIELIIKARVTVRANIQQLVGGAGEDTILARVGEGIITAVGLAENHEEVLADPNKISRLVLNKGLGTGTAFDILSIDISDVTVGENIGAQLQIDQANADLKVAESKAEGRRSMAIAVLEEKKAAEQDARVQVVLAEKEIPLALSEALRNGNLGIYDFEKLKNIQSDTKMRSSIATSDFFKSSKKQESKTVTEKQNLEKNR
jgi:uncharacterized protein YqfA (UPF0365 family)